MEKVRYIVNGKQIEEEVDTKTARLIGQYKNACNIIDSFYIERYDNLFTKHATSILATTKNTTTWCIKSGEDPKNAKYCCSIYYFNKNNDTVNVFDQRIAKLFFDLFDKNLNERNGKTLQRNNIKQRIR